ncbi:MAG: hypothetical protein BWX70_02391 [Verrucomicrobia bacterium ADurb.Bin070]|nr:MAG: hypothetical protein BWX70_02391 [Verrucomicrobia bacterium ADurb.Bin070]
MGLLAFTGGIGNAIHIFGESLDQAGDITVRLGQHLSGAGQWFKGFSWRLTPKASPDAAPVKHPGCFGISKELDRRTKRCRQCDFLNECGIAAHPRIG